MTGVDAGTLACSIFAIFGFFSLFVSQKPVTLGSCVMLAACSLATTQALAGVAPAGQGVNGTQLQDIASSAFGWVRERVTGERDEL
tara:strand:- start:313 stop:570 length:258 start_codon:yes stop_codon:yes gene_type:complete